MNRNTDAPVVRVLTHRDASLVRELYLKMFADSPDAFGETLESVRGRTLESWQKFVDRCATGKDQGAFVAEDLSGACGFVRVELGDPRTPEGTALLSELWVAPYRRGGGLGRELMNKATDWAKAHDAIRISLGVAQTNLGVLSFYETLGYKDTRIRVPLPSDPALQVVVLARSLISQGS